MIYCAVDRQKGRLAGFSLYVSNSDVNSLDAIKKTTLCYKDGPELPHLNLTKKCKEYGRYVIFYNERLNGIAYPEEYEVYSVFTELCEVNIKGKQKNPSVLNLNLSYFKKVCYFVLGYLLFFYNERLDEIVFPGSMKVQIYLQNFVRS